MRAFTIALLALGVNAAADTLPLTDVSPDHWAYPQVRQVVLGEVMEGVRGRFEGDREVHPQEAAEFARRILGDVGFYMVVTEELPPDAALTGRQLVRLMARCVAVVRGAPGVPTIDLSGGGDDEGDLFFQDVQVTVVEGLFPPPLEGDELRLDRPVSRYELARAGGRWMDFLRRLPPGERPAPPIREGTAPPLQVASGPPPGPEGQRSWLTGLWEAPLQ